MYAGARAHPDHTAEASPRRTAVETAIRAKGARRREARGLAFSTLIPVPGNLAIRPLSCQVTSRERSWTTNITECYLMHTAIMYMARGRVEGLVGFWRIFRAAQERADRVD